MNTDKLCCYLNGEFLEYRNCNIHISDLAFQRGYGVFDYFRIRKGKLLWLEDYIDRLYRSIELAELDNTISREEFRQIIIRLQEKNGLTDGAFKVIVTGGYSEGLDAVSGSCNFAVLNIPWQKPAPSTLKNGVELISLNYTRPLPEIKTLNYFSTLHLRKKMKEYQAVDVLYHNEMISECSRTNVFFVKDKQVYTPDSGVLKGITRKQILKMEPGITQTDIPFDQLYSYDEMFLSSTTRDITPVVGVDGKYIGSGKTGPITRELQDSFKRWSAE